MAYRKLRRTNKHRRSMLANLTKDLIMNEKIVTTEPYRITSFVTLDRILLRILFSLFNLQFFAISLYLLVY